MNNTTVNTAQNPYSKFNTYEEYMKQATDPQFISEMIATYGSYENYQKALKEKRARTNRIMRKVRIWHYGRMLIRIAVPVLIIVALFYVFFYM